MKPFAWVTGALLLFPPPLALRPQEKQPKPFWQSCDEIVPTQRPDDDSTYHLCIDTKGRRYEIVDRPVSRHCTETVPREPDTYQHFSCEEKYELMIRPERKP